MGSCWAAAQQMLHSLGPLLSAKAAKGEEVGLWQYMCDGQTLKAKGWKEIADRLVSLSLQKPGGVADMKAVLRRAITESITR